MHHNCNSDANYKCSHHLIFIGNTYLCQYCHKMNVDVWCDSCGGGLHLVHFQAGITSTVVCNVVSLKYSEIDEVRKV